MKSQLYVYDARRKMLKREIQSFTDFCINKILPLFEDIETEADQVSNAYYEECMSMPADDYVDPSGFAEEALERGLEHYNFLRLGKYNLISSWHASLYQLFEQQLRLFIFREMSHNYKIEFKSFCENFNDIREALELHGVKIKSFKCWPKIKELKLLCNVIKHGDGSSAIRLRKLNPSLFKKENDIDYMRLYKTTLLEETLSIDENSLAEYNNNLLLFWDEIPERNFSDDLK